jgi:transcriptional regulator with XRE-family HTH domain
MSRKSENQAARALPRESARESAPGPARSPTPDLAQRLAEIRASRGLTLREMQAATGIPASTLSKVQNGHATLSYGALVRLAQGLSIEVSDLFTSRAVDIKAGRRAVTKRGTGLHEATERYLFELLCSDLINKKMNPAILDITARSLREAGGLQSHDGEEFVYVLSGSVDVYSEDYRPARLEQGDALYLDSTSGHAYVNAGKETARVLAVTTQFPPEASRLTQANAT